MKNIINFFKKAGLSLQWLTQPLRNGRGMEHIFQMDIESISKGTRRFEKIRIYPGHKDNLIQVRSIDSKRKQLLLLVKEPGGIEFENIVALNSFNTIKRIEKTLPKDAMVIKIDSSAAKIVRKTAGDIRYFLLGVDERQLFIAQLASPATTVAEAHKSLGSTVQFSDGKRKNSVDRQGEWFFLVTSDITRDNIEDTLRRNKTVIHSKVAIGEFMNRRGGNPHTVDELVVMPRGATEKIDPGSNPRALLRRRIFIRGCVRHIDHKTIKFRHWREVIANNEGATAQASASGVFWVD